MANQDYEYLKEFEIDGNVEKLGHYTVSTWCSNNSGPEHNFRVTCDSISSETDPQAGIMFLTIVDPINGKRAIVNLSLVASQPAGVYTVLEDEDLVVNISACWTSNIQSTQYKVQCSSYCQCSIILQQQISCRIDTVSTSAPFYENLTKKITPIMLHKDVDYGTSLPTSAEEGRLFFLKMQ